MVHEAIAAGQFLVFALDDRLFGLRLEAVERVVRASEVTPLPTPLAYIAGIVNVHGTVLPVYNLRWRFKLPEREIDVGDRFIIARRERGTGFRSAALLVDDVRGLEEAGGDAVQLAASFGQPLDHVAGVMKLRDGLIVIQDVDAFLSSDEEAAVSAALEGARGG